MALTEGQMVGQYRILSQLGFGGMATVYKGYHPRLGRNVAIKVMHQAFREDQTFLARFEREAQIVARLEHPNIVHVYDFAEHEGQPYLVMKYVEGRTLKQVLFQTPPTLAEVVRVMSTIADALDYAHRMGVLHRDIKPSNIILAADGTPYITDFGLARMAQLNESTLSQDVLLGTPHYISPEQAMGSRDLTSATDLYSLGVVLYELLTGRVPYTSDTPFAVIHSHIYSPLPKASALNPDIPPAVDTVLNKALAKKPADRYPTATAMIEALKAAISSSGMTELNPERVRIATSRMDEVPPAYETPTPAAHGGTEARLNRLAGGADPEMTTAPAPLPRADDEIKVGGTPSASYQFDEPSPEAAAPKSAAPRHSPPRIPPIPAPPAPPAPPVNPGSLAQSIGSLAGSAARFAAETASRAIAEEWAKQGGKVMHRREDGAEILRLPGGGILVRRPGGVELRFGENDVNDADWAEKVHDKEWEEALNAILAENDEIAPPDDFAAARRRAKEQINRRNGFLGHLVAFVLVNAMLVFINLSTGDGISWAIFPFLGWGAGLAAHGVDTYFRTGMREARRISAIQAAYRYELGEKWYMADKRDLKRIRRQIDTPYRKRREFLTHLAVYLTINIMLAYIARGSDFAWNIIPALGWGIGLAAHFIDMIGWKMGEGDVEKIIARERAALEGTTKRKNSESVELRKPKNDERPNVRLNDDGEFTDSMVQELEADMQARRKKR